MSIAPDAMFTILPEPCGIMCRISGLAPVEDALEVDREDPLELLVGAVGHELVVRDAGDVADDVDPAVLGSGEVDERVDVGPLGHVGAADGRVAAVEP